MKISQSWYWWISELLLDFWLNVTKFVRCNCILSRRLLSLSIAFDLCQSLYSVLKNFSLKVRAPELFKCLFLPSIFMFRLVGVFSPLIWRTFDIFRIFSLFLSYIVVWPLKLHVCVCVCVYVCVCVCVCVCVSKKNKRVRARLYIHIKYLF